MPHTHPLIFDGHNDILSRLVDRPRAEALAALEQGDGAGHLDLPRMKAGGFGGGIFAIYITNPPEAGFNMSAMSNAEYDIPLPPPVPFESALPRAMAEASLLLDMDRAGLLRLCRTAAEVEAAMHSGQIAAVMHIEGAEMIDLDFHALDLFHAAGLRSLGPVWSRPNGYGHGAPFRFPSDGDTGPGLPDLGKALVQRCLSLGIMVDTAHMNMKEFYDVVDITDKPIVNSHSNAVAVTRHARNLTDDQLRVIGDSRGLVGLNFATAFLREDGQMRADTPLDRMIRHLDHMIDLAGEDCVALGSDFDGAVMPEEIIDVAGLPALRIAMTNAGYGPTLITKLCHGNWLRVMRETWGA